MLDHGLSARSAGAVPQASNKACFKLVGLHGPRVQGLMCTLKLAFLSFSFIFRKRHFALVFSLMV